MDTSRRAAGYDLFKLLIAIILLILFLFLLRRPANQGSQPVPAALSPTGAVPLPASATPEANSIPTLASTAPFPASPTVTSPAALTATNPDTATATPLAAPTEAPTLESTSTSTGESHSTLTACEAASSRSRLQMGMNASILRRLNFRSSPGIRNNWVRTNTPGTSVEVVGGPECLAHHAGAYVWWQIKLPDGNIGWSAEGSIHGTFYFMEPAE